MRPFLITLFVGLCVSVFCLPAPTFAGDLSEGTFIISGDSNFGFTQETYSYESDGDVKVSKFSLEATVGYVIMDMLEVGPILSYERTTTKNGSEVTDTTLTFGGYGKYYFDLQSEMYPYVGAMLGYFSNTEKNGSEVKTKGYALGLGGGIKYFLNEHFALDAGLRYSIGKGTAENGSSVDIDYSELELFAGVSVLL